MASFADILNRQVSDVKAPPPFPVGSYVAVVDGHGEWGESRQAKTKQIQFKARILQPQDDVDEEKLMEWKEATGDSITGQQVYLTFYDPQPWRLTEFLKNLGLENMPVIEAVANAPGRQFLVTLRHRPSQDGRTIQHDVASTAAI